jgi:hypothetical protein
VCCKHFKSIWAIALQIQSFKSVEKIRGYTKAISAPRGGTIAARRIAEVATLPNIATPRGDQAAHSKQVLNVAWRPARDDESRPGSRWPHAAPPPECHRHDEFRAVNRQATGKGGQVMWKAIKWLALALVLIVLREILLPVLGPVLAPVLPSVNELIQSTIASQADASLTVATRYAAAGYRDASDVLLTLMSLVIWGGLIAVGIALMPRLPRPIDSGWKRHAITALVVLGALIVGYFRYVLAAELGARTSAMRMYKLYQRKMTAVAPYISREEEREIHSRWALMNGKADLQAMDQRLLALMQQHGLLAGSLPAAKPE